jgi:CheY-like chemotaxis protein
MDPSRIHGKRILVVDDDAVTRESIRLLLAIDRHVVLEAADAVEAIALLSSQNVDLVILDYFMPGIPGDQLALNIRSLAPSLPILMISAYLEKIGACEKPVDAVLGKPFGLEELRRAVAQLVGTTASSRAGTCP